MTHALLEHFSVLSICQLHLCRRTATFGTVPASTFRATICPVKTGLCLLFSVHVWGECFVLRDIHADYFNDERVRRFLLLFWFVRGELLCVCVLLCCMLARRAAVRCRGGRCQCPQPQDFSFRTGGLTCLLVELACCVDFVQLLFCCF